MGTDDGKGMVQVGPPAGLPCSEDIAGVWCEWGCSRMPVSRAELSLVNAHLATALQPGAHHPALDGEAEREEVLMRRYLKEQSSEGSRQAKSGAQRRV